MPEELHVGTSTADLAYHACYAGKLDVDRGRRRPSLCGRPAKVTPHRWDEERQRRQDSCPACARRVRAIFDREAKERARAGPLVAGYLRASTDRQCESPDVQEATVRDYCTRWGLAPPRIYLDPAMSGGVPLLNRPAGGRLARDLRRGDHVVVARIDRLSRNFLDFASTIDTWNRLGVTLHPCDFPMRIQPDEPLSQCFVQVLAIFAAYERRMIAQRTKEALHWRIEQGRKHGRDAPFGFRFELRADGHYYTRIDDHEAAICIKVVELLAAGYTYRQAAHYLNHEWGVRNPRTRMSSDGGLRRHRKGCSPSGLFHYSGIRRLLEQGCKILHMQGRPLPGGAAGADDIVPRRDS